jgi:4-hydroxy-3-methylbut-2-enyl diphosphate reductase IspH
MNVILAESAGFCFGVKRAVDTVYEKAADSDVPVYTFGPIIHNEEVVRDLEEKGVHAVCDMEELEKIPSGEKLSEEEISQVKEQIEFMKKYRQPDSGLWMLHVHLF